MQPDITIAIGPVTVMPDQWLPRIFGSEADEPMPEFPSLKVVKRVIDLIMRLYSSVIMAFEIAPNAGQGVRGSCRRLPRSSFAWRPRMAPWATLESRAR